jgi:hypothetical protein
MSIRPSAVTVVALALLVGCGPSEPGVKTLRAVAALKDPQTIEIDYRVHEAAFVRPGDRIEWICDCDPRIQFSVESPRLVADVDALTEMQLGSDWNREDVQALAQRLAETAPSRERGADQATYDVQEVQGEAADPITAAQAFLEAIAEALPPAGAPGLFESPLPPEFVDSDRTIRSYPVASEVGTGVWKFTWKFRLKDDPTKKEVVWDPHIFSDAY